MKSVLAALSRPFWGLLHWLRGNLLGRYVRALSSSARMSLAVLTGLVVAILGLSAFSNPEVDVDATPEAIPVVARAAHPQALAPEIHVFGRVENPNTTELRAATLAYVSEVNVREGQAVAAGDVLMRLDDRDAQLAVRRAEAALAEARGEHARVIAQQESEVKNLTHQRRLFELTVKKQERFRTLFSKGQISATDYDDLEQQRIQMEITLNQQELLLASHSAQRASSEARVKRADADWQGSVLNLERLALVAPFNGTIIQLNAAMGARIDAGQTVMTLFNADSQQVRVSLPERDASALQVAQANGDMVTASARVADRWVTLDLLDIGSEVRSGRAGTDVIFAAPDDTALALGRAVDVKITLPAQEGLLEVPLQGVYADRIVYTVEDDMLKAVNVERVGIREDEAGNMTLLVRAEGLHDGDPVVISSLSRASTGALVRVLPNEDAEAAAPRELTGSPDAVAAR